ncbi:hypothetical protein ACHZ97_14660 [Lysobacter soli]|uniref:Rz1-like lysis system protein LysC n=1 Tax=Lysobacter soli TaxID=453783 RepID=UPI0037CA3E3B
MRRTALIAVLLLAGCAGNPPLPEPPQIVRVPVTKYVPLDEALTADCAEVPKKSNSYGEAIRLANARKLALEACTKRMRDIRALQPKP